MDDLEKSAKETPKAPSKTQTYDKKLQDLIQQQQQQRKTPDAPGKDTKEKAKDKLRMFYD